MTNIYQIGLDGTVRHDLVDLPLRAHCAVEAELVNVSHVLAKNRLAVARPNR